MASSSLRVAFIGAGWVCRERHLPCFGKHAGVECFGVIDINAEAAQRVAARFQLPHASVARRPEDCAWLAGADALCITVPPQHHYEWLAWGVAHNKHILIEKPIVVGRAEGVDIFARLSHYKGMFCVTHNTLFTHAAKQTRAWIREGKLGAITDYSSTLYNSPRRHLPDWYDDLPFGLLYDELSHFLYNADSLCPELRVLSGETYPSRSGLRSTPSAARLTLASRDFPVFFNLHFESPLSEWHIIVSGTKGMLINDVFRDILVFLPNDREHRAWDHVRTLRRAVADYTKGFISTGWRHLSNTLFYGTDEVITRFVQACQTSKPPERINVSDARRVFLLLCDCVDALNDGRVNFQSSLVLKP
ncbi:MAG: Gfo/Idh/MocA family oxidoreductase [Kiritimatiellae bacterium]|nr:Gfo/Idh/MocA family oxidoreductase [Kiritimatiellia bacterium]